MMPPITVIAPWCDLNLLASRRQQQRRHRYRFWLALCVPMLASGAGLLAWHHHLQAQLATAALATTESTGHALDDLAQEDQRWLVAWLQQRGQGVELLTTLAAATPPGVALQALMQEETHLRLIGQTSRPAAVNRLVQALQQQTPYRQLRRLEASAAVQQQGPVQQFALELARLPQTESPP